MQQLDVVAGRREDDGLLPGAVHHLVVSMIVRIMVYLRINPDASPTPTPTPTPTPLPTPNLVEQQ